jgi:hypothetical protein
MTMIGLRSASAQVQKQALWDAFRVAHRIAETGVRLFATASGWTEGAAFVNWRN